MVVYGIRFVDDFDSYLSLGLFEHKADALALAKKTAEGYVRTWSKNSISRDSVKMEQLENGFKVTDGEEDYTMDILVQEIAVQ